MIFIAVVAVTLFFGLYMQKIDLLLAKQNTKLSEQLKISKSINKASEDYDKALKELV